MGQRGKPPAGYLTASTARKRLGDISDGMLRSYIQRGLLERVIPAGRKQGFYRRDQVEHLAREIQSPWYSDTRAGRTQFRQATPADIETIADIDERIFNEPEEEPTPREVYLQWDRETYLRWMQRNPQTFFVLTNATGKVVGFASLLPLTQDTLDRLVRDDILWKDIPNEDIDLFEPGKPLHLYVIAVAIDPVFKGMAKESYGARILRGVFDFFLGLARQGVEIETITARNYLHKLDGRRLSQKLGLPLLRSPIAHMNLFSIRVAESGYPLFVEYSNLLETWKREHRKEQ